MNILSGMDDFLLSEWLWNVTRDWYHIPISMILCTLAFTWVLRMRFLPSLVLSVSSVLFAFLTFSIFIVGVLVYIFNFDYSSSATPNYFFATFYLGFIFTFLQTIFYFIIHHWYHLKIPALVLITFICNSFTSIISYYLLYDPLM